jgi:dihydrofolate reductase
MKLTASMMLTVDGVYQGPGGPDEDRRGGFERGGWTAAHTDEEMWPFLTSWFERADALLLGRKTWEIWEPYWPHHDSGDPVSRRRGASALPRAWPDARPGADRVAGDTLRRDDPDLSTGRPRDLRDRRLMGKIVAAITTSVDGYITGPDDGPGKGLGEGGERLHYWVMGGPWSYEDEPQVEPEGEDAEYLNEMTARAGAIVVGRTMYEAADHWGDKNPFGMPVFVVTHRPEEEPDTGEFSFVGGFEEAIDRAKEAAGDKAVSIGGGGDVIRQGLDAGIVDELHIIVAPVILGGGKHLFEDFTKSLDLENRGVRQSRWATFMQFAVRR